jgi:carboxyl-terminal processing protease
MTDPRTSNRRLILITAVFTFLLILLCGGMGVYVLSDPGLHESLSIARIAVEVRNTYPGPLDWNHMFDRAMENMFQGLDRYSGYVKSEQLARFDEELSGGYGGIGVSVMQHEHGLLIMSVREHGPAADAGLLSGDIILEADSTNLQGLSVDESSRILRGDPGTEVVLVIQRPASDDTLTIAITRKRIDLLHVPFAGYTPDSLLYIRLLDFDAGAAADVKAALDSLITDSRSPRGVILDLRSNPGGLLSEAFHTADLFLDGGQLIVGTEGRSRWNDEKYYSTGNDITRGAQMAVIVDRGSASAAEIVAGALQQLKRAVLVGDTTFGKGLVQGFTRFWDGSGLRLTISRYYLDGGVYLNEFDSVLIDTGHGLAPDYYFRFVERHEFPRALESSLLLTRFANLHEEEIIASSGHFRLPDTWVDRFRSFAVSAGFDFESRATEALEVLNDVAFADHARVPLIKRVGEVLRKARRDDNRQFEKYASYIKMRLKQIAYERKFGMYRAYAEVLVRERPEIVFASNLLLQKPS